MVRKSAEDKTFEQMAAAGPAILILVLMLAILGGIYFILKWIKENIDLIHSFLFTQSIYSYFASKVVGVKKQITRVRNLEIRCPALVEILNRFVLNNSYRVVFNSYKVRDYYRHKFNLTEDNLRVVYNGIDIKRFENATPADEMKRELGISSAAKVIGMAC